jgi:hypothetical protein
VPDRGLSLVLARKQPFRGDWTRLARRKDGEEIWALIASPQVVDQMPAASRAVFDRVAVIADTTDEAWWETVLMLSREATVSRIATNDEYCLALAGALRDRLGCVGPGGRASRAYTDKIEMKTQAARQGIRVPRFSPASARGDALEGLLEEFRKQIAGPVVVKPVEGANSREVVVIADRAATASIDWGAWTGGPYQVEEFVAGDIFFCDTLVGEDASVTPLMFGEYLNPPLAFASGRPHGSVSLPFEDPVAKALWAQNALVLQALPEVRGTVTHCELIRARATGEWVLMECAARAPGAYVARSGEVVVGQNLEEIHLATQLGLTVVTPTPNGQHAAWVWYRQRPGKVCEVREPQLAASAELSWMVFPGDEILELPLDGNAEAQAALTVFLSGSYETVRADFELLRDFEPVVMG